MSSDLFNGMDKEWQKLRKSFKLQRDILNASELYFQIHFPAPMYPFMTDGLLRLITQHRMPSSDGRRALHLAGVYNVHAAGWYRLEVDIARRRRTDSDIIIRGPAVRFSTVHEFRYDSSIGGKGAAIDRKSWDGRAFDAIIDESLGAELTGGRRLGHGVLLRYQPYPELILL